MSYEENKRRILNKLNADIYDKLAVAGEIIVAAAKSNCPVGKYTDGTVGGRLRSSISWATKRDNGGKEGHERAGSSDDVSRPDDKLVLKIGTNVEYAKFVELGTKFQKRRAFLRLALAETRNTVKRIFRS